MAGSVHAKLINRDDGVHHEQGRSHYLRITLTCGAQHNRVLLILQQSRLNLIGASIEPHLRFHNGVLSRNDNDEATRRGLRWLPNRCLLFSATFFATRTNQSASAYTRHILIIE